MIDTSHSTYIGVEKNFTLKFAQLLLIAHRAVHQLRKVRTDNLKFRTDLRDRDMDIWSVTQ